MTDLPPSRHRLVSAASLAGLLLLLSCSPATPAPASATAESLDSAKRFSDEWIDRDPAMLWSWGEYVLLYGMWELYRATGDEAVRDYIATFVEENHTVYEPIASDWFSPATLDMLLCGEIGAPANCDRVPAYDAYFETVHREEGAMVHWTADEQLRSQIWVDTLFMAGIYAIERPRQLDAAAAGAWYDDIALQFTAFDRYLGDQETGLLNHAYDFADEAEPFTNGPGAFWGRGNSWYVAAIGNLLRTMPTDNPHWADMEALWRKRLDALLPLQDSLGFWHTILTRPGDDYPEASATALIAYGIAGGLNAGLAYPGAREAVELALQGLNQSLIDDDGTLTLPQISRETEPGTIEDYLDVRIGSNVHYGIGAYLLAAIELARLNEEQPALRH